MKNKQSLSLLLLALILGTFTACQKTKVTEKDGIECTYIEEGSEKAPNGDFYLYNLEIKNDEDSVIYSTLEQPVPGYLMANDSIPVNNGMDEIFMALRKGDSLHFSSTVQIIFGGNHPPTLNAEDNLHVKLGVFDYVSQDSLKQFFSEAARIDAEKRAERAKVLLVEEGEKIEAYASENGIELQKTENGLYYSIEKPGTGAETSPGTTLYVDYAGYLLDGTLFDTSIKSIAEEQGTVQEGRPYEPLPVNVGMGQVIPGWDEGLMLLKKGSKAKFFIPSPLGYGENGAGGLIGPNSILVFDVEVKDVQK